MYLKAICKCQVTVYYHYDCAVITIVTAIEAEAEIKF